MSHAVEELTGAEEIVWELSDLYQGSEDPALTQDMESALEEADRFAERYRGRVGTLSAAELAGALTEAEALYERIGKLSSFAGLQWNANTADPAFGALLQRVREAGSQFNQKTLFFDLEWAAVSDAQAQIAEAPLLARWRHYLENARKLRPHLLSEPEEKLLTEKNLTGATAWVRFYDELNNSMEFDWE